MSDKQKYCRRIIEDQKKFAFKLVVKECLREFYNRTDAEEITEKWWIRIANIPAFKRKYRIIKIFKNE
jgi:hypothetical protein